MKAHLQCVFLYYERDDITTKVKTPEWCSREVDTAMIGLGYTRCGAPDEIEPGKLRYIDMRKTARRALRKYLKVMKGKLQ